MKLAEALILRADRQKRLEQLKQRVIGSAKVQEGDEPPENPQELIEEIERVTDELLGLIQRINRTNTLTDVTSGKSLSDILAERDVLMTRRTIYADLAKSASVVQARTSRSEVKFKSTGSVPDVQKRVDDLSKTYRE
ncbi:MAG: DIP1984 family protein, partial [Janthinobacterium lividum]